MNNACSCVYICHVLRYCCYYCTAFSVYAATILWWIKTINTHADNEYIGCVAFWTAGCRRIWGQRKRRAGGREAAGAWETTERTIRRARVSAVSHAPNNGRQSRRLLRARGQQRHRPLAPPASQCAAAGHQTARAHHHSLLIYWAASRGELWK